MSYTQSSSKATDINRELSVLTRKLSDSAIINAPSMLTHLYPSGHEVRASIQNLLADTAEGSRRLVGHDVGLS